MKLVTKIGISFLSVFTAAQFIQPRQNKSVKISASDITNIFYLPDSVEGILKTSCFDCHSNNTNYPWYTYIQPLGWFIKNDIEKGKSQLNLSEFGSYSSRRQKSKLVSIENRIKDGTMPLKSYIRMHKNAAITEYEQKLLSEWISIMTDSLNRK